MTINETRNVLTILKTLYPTSFVGFNNTQGEILLHAWSVSLKDYSYKQVINTIYDIYSKEKSLYMPKPARVKEEIDNLSKPLLTSKEDSEEYHDLHCNNWVDEYINDEMWEKYFGEKRRKEMSNESS